MIDPNTLIELAETMGIQDSIDWDKSMLDKEVAYESMSITTLEMFENIQSSDDKEVLLLATILKLMVENLALKIDAQNQTDN